MGHFFQADRWRYALAMCCATYPEVQSEKNTVFRMCWTNSVCTGTYNYILVHTFMYTHERNVSFSPWDIAFRLIDGGMHLPCTVQHILMSKVKKTQFSECAGRTRYIQVHTSTYKYIRSCTHTPSSQSLFTSNQALSAL